MPKSRRTPALSVGLGIFDRFDLVGIHMKAVFVCVMTQERDFGHTDLGFVGPATDVVFGQRFENKFDVVCVEPTVFEYCQIIHESQANVA